MVFFCHSWDCSHSYDEITSGENLTNGLDDKSAMNALMNSEGHKRNILDPDYEEIGVGRCGPYLVQHFGTQKK